MQLRLGTRLGFGYALLIVVLGVTLLLSLLSFEAVRHEARRVRGEHIPTIEASNDMLLALEAMDNAEFEFFEDRGRLSVWNRRFDQATTDFQAAYDQAENQNPLTGERSLLTQIGRHYGAYQSVHAHMKAMLAHGDLAGARSLNQSESLREADAIRAEARNLRRLNLEAIAGSQAKVDRGFKQTEIVASLAVLLGALLSIGLWWRTSRDVVDPLLALQKATRDMSEGRYAAVASPAATHTYELAALQADFNAMGLRLAEATADLKAANNSLESQVEARTRELQQANARLEQSLEELKSLDKLKSDFMAIVSHELLTPINFITGYGSALEDGVMGELNTEQTAAVLRMLEGAQRLTRMVRNVLDYTQLDSGRLVILPEEVELAPLVTDALEAMVPLLKAKHQALEVSVPEQLPNVYADPARVSQLIMELLDNAVKFTGEGGRIAVRALVSPERVQLEVSDTGIGIQPEALPHLFQHFYQADFSSTRRYGGLGLGLALVHYLVTRMGGSVLVRSQFGQGSSFVVSLPRADARSLLKTIERQAEA